MNIDRFTDLLDLHGADLAQWPAPERSAAEALVATDATARQHQRDALAFEALLQRATLPELDPSAALRQRILAQAMQAGAAPGWRMQMLEALGLLFPTGRAVPQFAALALALAIGVSAGFTNFGLADTQETDLVSVQIASATPLLLEE